MNNEELVKSLRTEINTYLKNTVADLQQELAEMQDRLTAEIDRHRGELEKSFGEMLAKGAAAGVDDDFTRLVAEHLQIAFEDGSKEGTESAEAKFAALPQPEPVTEIVKEIVTETVTEPANYKALRDATNEISTQSSQAEILKSLVKHASDFAPRGAFFIVKSEHLVGWRTFGREMSGTDDSVREVFLSANSDTMLGASIKQNATQSEADGGKTQDAQYLQKLNFGTPNQMVAVPLVVRGRGVAVLYADSGANDSPIYVEAIESLVRVASLTVELLAAAKSPAAAQTVAAKPETAPPPVVKPAEKVSGENSNQTATGLAAEPTPAIADYSPAPPQPEPAFVPPVTVEPIFSAEPVFEPQPAATAQTADYQVSYDEAAPPVEEVKSEAFEPDFSAPAAAAVTENRYENFGFDSPVQPVEAETAFEKPIEKPVEAAFSFENFASPQKTETAFSFDTAPSVAAPVTVEPPVQPVATSQTAPRRFGERTTELPIDVPEDERRQHNDARRFARLLVSEIKLYNEQKVKEGRQVGDLYSRLREAVDRSREMYDKRVSPPVAARFDYFHFELVNTLAEGDEGKLGGDYPGASV